MIFPVAAILILWFLLSRSKLLPTIRLSTAAMEKIASVVAVLASFAVLLRGNVWAALITFGIGLWLLGRVSRQGRGAVVREASTLSRVRSAMIEMDYDHADGTMTGRIIAGQHEGHALDRLDKGQCETIYAICRRDDPEGARLLEAYLHRRFAGWRPTGQADDDAGERRARHTSRMTEDEAYEVLGLRRGATRDEVVRAHRAVMKKWHPDQGGTADLAARANEAKEVLLRRKP